MAAKKAGRKTTRRKAKASRRSALPLIAGLAGALGVALVALQFLPERSGESSEDPRPAPTKQAGDTTPAPELVEPSRPPIRVEPPTARTPPLPSKSAPSGVRGPKPRAERRAGIPKVAIVIDDCGYDQELARDFAKLETPLTFAVIPHLAGSGPCAEEAFRRGHEVILHQPMQPESYPETKVGEGALLLGMRRKQVVSTLSQNLGSIPHVSGLNNHMGSAATADRVLMGHAMDVLVQLKEQYPGLYFLDSKTSADTVAYDMARRRGLRTAMRTVFLDHDESLASVKAKLDELLAIAEEEGEAIGIGHVKPNTLAALESTLARLGPDEFDFVFASELAH